MGRSGHGDQRVERVDGAARASAAREQDPAGVADRGQIRPGGAKSAHDPDAAGHRIDRDDPARRGAERRAAASDDNHLVAQRRSRSVRRRRRQPPDELHSSRRDADRVDRTRGSAVRKRAPGDHQAVAHSRNRGVANRRRQVSDHPGTAPGTPADDRVEPRGARVAADHVGSAARARRRLIGARCRQPAGARRASGGRVDADDLAVLRRPIAASEDVDGGSKPHRGGIVHGYRQPPESMIGSGRRDQDRRSRRGRRGEPSCQQQPAAREARPTASCTGAVSAPSTWSVSTRGARTRGRVATRADLAGAFARAAGVGVEAGASIHAAATPAATMVSPSTARRARRRRRVSLSRLRRGPSGVASPRRPSSSRFIRRAVSRASMSGR